MISDSDGDKMTKFIGELKIRMLAMHSAIEAGDIPNGQKLGIEAAESLLTWNPVQHGAMTMALAFEAASLDAEVKELKEALDSWENPVVIPAGPVADAINHFLAHPETGILIDPPTLRRRASGRPASSSATGPRSTTSSTRTGTEHGRPA